MAQKHRVYLDWNATAPLRDEARAACTAALDLIGNPSSVHAEGRQARGIIEAARNEVAALVGADAACVTFTSGGTEANALALTPGIDVGSDKAPRDVLLISAIEHPSVRSGGGFSPDAIEDIPVTADGVVDLAWLESRLAALATEGRRPLVSIMLANNESGAIQPIADAAEMVHAANGLIHVDAVQAAGKIPFTIQSVGADLLSITAHKFGGPKGAGALIRRDQALHFPSPLIRGGGQERGLRAGTENVAAVAGFGAAAAACRRECPTEAARTLALRERLEAGLKAISPDMVIFAAGVERLPNTTLFAVPGMKAETLVIALDLDGIAVSSGAACSSGKVQSSHVLAAMGVEPVLARGEVRVSIGYPTTPCDIDRFLDAWTKLARSLNKGAGGIAA